MSVCCRNSCLDCLPGLYRYRAGKGDDRNHRNKTGCFVKNCKKELYNSQKAMENEVRNALRKLMFKKTKRYPIIFPNIIFN